MAMEFTVLAAVLAAILALLVHTAITGISPVPTTPRVAAAMLSLARPGVDGAIFELGSGWGSLAFALARRFPDRRVIAYELSPLPWLVSRLRQALLPAPNLTIRRADFHQVSLAEAALVCCYLYPGAMARLRPKFEAELGPGAAVISNSFAIPGWPPAAMRRADDQYGSPVYLYEMPRRERRGARAGYSSASVGRVWA